MKCRYCYGKCVDDFGKSFPFEVDDSLPSILSYDLADLNRFIGKDPAATIIFYGGEPTLALDKMFEIMDKVPARAYMMQTNGLLLDKIDAKYCRRFDTVLISLDGDEALTDYYRGAGTYRRVVDNLKLFRSRGFGGELIARMTVDPETDVLQAVKWLLFNEEFLFKSVHWQLDAQFWRSDYEKETVQRWFEQYNKEVQALVDFWVSHMEHTGEVLRIYPLIGIMESLLGKGSSKLRCGAGWTEFNIQTDGFITPCPVMAGIKEFYLGDIWKTDPKHLVDTVLVKEPCPHCGIYEICGGRCLYANATKLWGEEGHRLVCGTVENLVDSLKAVQHRINALIKRKQISLSDFNYPKYNSCEIIP